MTVAADRLHFILPGRIDQPTGGYRYAARIVAEMRAQGTEVLVHALAGRHPEPDTAARLAAAACLAGLPDGARLVLDGLALPAFEACLRAHRGRLRLHALVHHPLPLEAGLDLATRHAFAALEAALLPCCSSIVVTSPTTRGLLATGYGLDADRIRVVRPGTDRPRGRPAGRISGPTRLLCVATLTPRKGHLRLLAALAHCRDLDWRLVCVGPTDRDPATARAVRAAVSRLGLGGRVRLTGALPEAAMPAQYAAADVFVLASALEGYGMAFAEAMAHGLPIVGTGAGAVRETVPRAAGLIVPVTNREALTRALRAVLSHASLRRRLAAGARRAGRRLPSWPQSAAAFAQAVAAA